jgi:uncharacterized RDD family membrane protein YckC
MTMVWYFVKNGQQTGPIEDAAFAELVRNGTVGPDTLIWNGSMTDWKPCSQAYPTTSQPAAAMMPAGNTCTCSECGRQFPDDQVVPLAGGFVCAGCKPMALRKLQEGVVHTGEMEIADAGSRIGARILDVLISMVFILPIYLGMIFLSASQGESAVAIFGMIFAVGFILLAPVTYEAFFLAKYSATPGKKILKLIVVRPDGSKLTTGRAIGRAFGKMLTEQTCLIGYIIAFFDDRQRTLHDHICDTRVIRRKD